MIQKITNPLKQATDPVLLSALATQGVDKDYVEFFRDYAPGNLGKEHSPYAKFYRDLQSNKRFMVVSGLPMADADGVKIECGWRVAGINYFSEKNNLFRARVQDADVELIIRNDQPDGRKANDRLSYKPQLFIDGIELFTGAPTLLPVDPVNPNYVENTLEWDYGICKRRLRLIEGSILGSWVFASKPNGEIRIKYNQIGDYKLRLGQFKISDDEEVVKPEDLDFLAKIFGYPVIISDTATFYPDANPETTSVDGRTLRSIGSPGELWATLIAGNGSLAYPSDTADIITGFGGYSGYGNYWYHLARGIFLFDTSSLPDNAIISVATLSLYGSFKADPLSANPDINIYSSNPASNTDLVSGDFTTLGTTAFSTTIAYADWSVTGYNNFTLNASGLAVISKTGVTKYGVRDVTHDIGASEPPNKPDGDNNSGLRSYFAEQGAGYKPKLVVTYTVAAGLENKSANMADKMMAAGAI